VLTLDQQGHVFILRMQDNENRFNFDSVARIHDALDKVEAAPDPIALVTVGEGKFYSNGLDLDWMMKVEPEQALENVARVQGLVGRVLALPCVTVAALNGHTFAAGAMLALSHDYRIMRSDRGFFCLPEVDIGMSFPPPMQSLITARLSKATAHEAMILGKRYTSAEALAASIVHQSVAEA
jgi:enoyl-CoA hydratase/carnithine racemase